MQPSDGQLRDWLDSLQVKQLRALAVDMRYRWESRRAELINFMVEYRPQVVLRAYAEDHSGTPTKNRPTG